MEIVFHFLIVNDQFKLAGQVQRRTYILETFPELIPRSAVDDQILDAHLPYIHQSKLVIYIITFESFLVKLFRRDSSCLEIKSAHETTMRMIPAICSALPEI